MLILTRRAGEAILIDGGVRIIVLGTDGGGVRLGIEAPSSVGIVREEVAQRLAEENARAGAAEEAKGWPEAPGGPGGPRGRSGEEDPTQGEKGGG